MNDIRPKVGLKWSILVEFDQNEFDQNSQIWPNLTFKFEFRNLKYRNLNEFERIRPSLYSSQKSQAK